MSKEAVNSSYGWLIAAICVYSIGAFIVGILFALECGHGIRYQIQHKKKKTRKRVTSTKPMWFITIFSILGFCITCGFGITTRIITMYELPEYLCYHTGRMGSFLYIISKQLMYLLFILRLYTVYKDSQYAYRLNSLACLAVVSVLFSLGCIILMNFYGQSSNVVITGTSYKNCVMSFPLFLTAYAALNDLVNQTVLIYLFVKPLISLQKEHLNANARTRSEFRKLSLKYYILGLTASISTVLFLLTVPSIGTVIFAAVDCIINSFCLLFCFHHWDRQYRFVCKGFIALVECLCFGRTDIEMHLHQHNLSSVASATKDLEVESMSPQSMSMSTTIR